MAAAVAGPMPGSESSSAGVARLRSTGPIGTVSVAATAPGASTGGGTASPSTGTYTRSPSRSGAARFRASTSAPGAAASRCREGIGGARRRGHLVDTGRDDGAGDVDDECPPGAVIAGGGAPLVGGPTDVDGVARSARRVRQTRLGR